MASEISLTLKSSPELMDGYVRIDQGDLRAIGAMPGNFVSIAGKNRFFFAKILPARMEDRNQGLILISDQMQRHMDIEDGQPVRVEALHEKPVYAEKIYISVKDDVDYLYVSAHLASVAAQWHDRVVASGDITRIPTLDRHTLEVTLSATEPSGPVLCATATEFVVEKPSLNPIIVPLAGLRDSYLTCKNLTQKRLRGDVAINAKAILLTGPAGCGKAQLVKRLAEETAARLRVLDAHQLLDRQIRMGSLDLEGFFLDLSRLSPLIVLLDNMQVLNGTNPACHTVATQLCAMLDELRMHRGTLLFGVCSGDPDPRFLSDRRFDLVLPIDAPNRLERHEILLSVAQNIMMDDKVDLRRLSVVTRGYTASDLQRVATTAQLSSLDGIVRDDDFLAAMRTVPPSVPSPVYCDMPDVAWEDIGGLDEVKASLQETILWSLAYRDPFGETGVKPPRSVLVSGADGTGKTSLVRAISGIIPVRFVEIDCQTLVTRDQATAASFIRDSFALARRKAPCVVFFDDIDAFFDNLPMSGEEPIAPRPVVAQFLIEMDDLLMSSGVVLIGATSRPDRLANEMLRPGRFDYALSLPLPDSAARKRILQIHARRLPLASDVDFDRLSQSTSGMTPADIASLCNRAGLLALRQSIDTEGANVPPIVTAALFDQILRGKKA
jgi:transitional endoplasmic reticulum ATPase